VFKKSPQVKLNLQTGEIIAKQLFLLSIIGGQFLSKVLKASIISRDFYLSTTLIHKQSTIAVE
jgi:hypothetical protein